MSQLISKKEAMALLNISASTLSRWMMSAKVRFTRTESGRFESSVWFDVDDLAQFLPTPEPLAPAAPPELYTASDLPYQDTPVKNDRSCSPMPPEPMREFGDDPVANLRAWLEGLLADSSGNYNYGRETPDGSVTDQRSLIYGSPSIAGCRPVKLGTADHMDQALVGSTGPGAGAAYINSPEYALLCGHISQTTYDQVATKPENMSSQDQKIFVDRGAMLEGFKHGYSR
jgi:hypothetical protein